MRLEYNEAREAFHDYGQHQPDADGWRTIEENVSDEVAFIFCSYVTSLPRWTEPPFTYEDVRLLWVEFDHIRRMNDEKYRTTYFPTRKPGSNYVVAKEWGYDYNIDFPPMNCVYNRHTGYDNWKQECLFYEMLVLEGERWHISYHGKTYYFNVEWRGSVEWVDEDWHVYKVWPTATAFLKDFMIDGRLLYEIVDELDEIEKE